MVFMNYIYGGSSTWELSTSTVMRSVMSERKNRSTPKHLYQKLLALVWSLMAVILISAYKGNLLAMITKPSMNAPFTNADDMVQQSGMKWGIWEKEAAFAQYATSRPEGTTLRRMIDQAMKCRDPWCRSTKGHENLALIASLEVLMYGIANDKTDTCYLTQDKFLLSTFNLAFQVCKLTLLNINTY